MKMGKFPFICIVCVLLTRFVCDEHVELCVVDMHGVERVVHGELAGEIAVDNVHVGVRNGHLWLGFGHQLDTHLLGRVVVRHGRAERRILTHEYISSFLHKQTNKQK